MIFPESACSPGEFPECGCHYTTADDGIHFCPMHKAAPDLLAVCKLFLVACSPGTGNPHSAGSVTLDTITLLAKAVAKAEGHS